MELYSLYIKEHKETGLCYLGFTKHCPFKYKGSGKNWIKHIKKYGNNVETIVLHECEDLESIKKLGQFYSNLLDVVNNPNFANIIPEGGSGWPKNLLKPKSVSDKIKLDWKINKEKRSYYNKGRTWKLTEDQKKAASENSIKNGYGFTKKTAKVCKNTIWINNGLLNKRIKINQQIPKGFSKGRITPWQGEK